MAFWTKKSEVSSPPTNELRASTPTSPSKPSVATVSEVKPTEGVALTPSNTISVATVPSNSGETGATRSSIRTAISFGTKIQGKLNFDAPVHIDGFVKGEIFSSKHLSIGASAQIEATVVAPSITVAGVMSGKVTVSERIDIRSGATVMGEVKAPSLVLEEGGILNAKVSMGLEIPAKEPLSQRIEKTTVAEKAERTAALAPRTSVALDAKLPSNSQMH